MGKTKDAIKAVSRAMYRLSRINTAHKYKVSLSGIGRPLWTFTISNRHEDAATRYKVRMSYWSIIQLANEMGVWQCDKVILYVVHHQGEVHDSWLTTPGDDDSSITRDKILEDVREDGYDSNEFTVDIVPLTTHEWWLSAGLQDTSAKEQPNG